MIKRIAVKGIATYPEDNAVVIDLKKINYFYGNNGSGKTALGKYLQNQSSRACNGCSIEWEDNPIQVLVYNNDFAQLIYGDSSDIPGIFTLGEGAKEAKDFIEFKKAVLKSKSENRDKNKASLVSEKEKKNALLTELGTNIWNTRVTYNSIFPLSMKGNVKDKITFTNHCLEIDKHRDKTKALTLESLTSNYNKFVAKEMKKYSPFSSINYSNIGKEEHCDLLETIIVGKKDIHVGDLIDYLGNSDWVRQGISYTKKKSDICPFCQQPINIELLKKINDYFDKTYLTNLNTIENFKASYESYYMKIINTLKNIDKGSFDLLDFTQWNSIVKELEDIYHQNISTIEYKISHLSEKNSIVSLKYLLDKLSNLISSFNDEINKNNNILEHLDEKKIEINKNVWEFICASLKPTLDKYYSDIKIIDLKISGMTSSFNNAENDITMIKKEIQGKEKEVSNIISVSDDINDILDLFGFTSFKIEPTREKGSYRLIRDDNIAVNKTLSEGEYRFITFLYFYHLTKGSTKSDNISEKKIVVIDDPISSLDSNILYIVSTLVRDIINCGLNNENGIEQVLILTHNTYFHKEITYGRKNCDFLTGPHKCFIIKKKNKITDIVALEGNPFKTTYEILWRTLDDTNQWEMPFVYNAMRRILEYYFFTICGFTKDQILNNIEKDKLLLCTSLLSYINDGSHFIYDDYVMCADSIDIYMEAFEHIFKVNGQENHFNAMREKSRVWKPIN
ncbi:MAG: AAA family ATPase [Mobilitalea sp.]